MLGFWLAAMVFPEPVLSFSVFFKSVNATQPAASYFTAELEFLVLSKMREGFVGLGHADGIVLLFDSVAFTVGSAEQLVG